jgi:hypothetical protein
LASRTIKNFNFLTEGDNVVSQIRKYLSWLTMHHHLFYYISRRYRNFYYKPDPVETKQERPEEEPRHPLDNLTGVAQDLFQWAGDARVLGCNHQGKPFGLLGQQIFARKLCPDHERRSMGGKYIQDVIPVEEKEGFRWIETLNATAMVSAGTQVVNVPC